MRPILRGFLVMEGKRTCVVGGRCQRTGATHVVKLQKRDYARWTSEEKKPWVIVDGLPYLSEIDKLFLNTHIAPLPESFLHNALPNPDE